MTDLRDLLQKKNGRELISKAVISILEIMVYVDVGIPCRDPRRNQQLLQRLVMIFRFNSAQSI